jgi:hypothetical protein
VSMTQATAVSWLSTFAEARGATIQTRTAQASPPHRRQQFGTQRHTHACRLWGCVLRAPAIGTDGRAAAAVAALLKLSLRPARRCSFIFILHQGVSAAALTCAAHSTARSSWHQDGFD